MNTPGKSALDSFLQRVRPLYTMPAVALDVLALADDPRIDATRLKSCIERDPALTAKLLRVVNSSLFSPARPVADLSQAVSLLGLRAVKLLALGFCLPERMFAAQASQAVAHYWRRALLRAVAARELAAVAKWKEGDEAFLAGLLADVGVAVLLQETTDDYVPLYQGAQVGDFDLLDAERRVFKFDHAELTQRLLAEWRLPAAISTTIAETRDGGDDKLTLRRPARLLYVAELLAAVVLDDRADLWPALVAGAERHLRLSPNELAELGAVVETKTSELAGAFQARRLTDGAVRAMLDRAGQLMPAAAEAAVADLLARRRTSPSPADGSSTGVVVRTLPGKPDPAPPAPITADELRPLYDYLRTAAIGCRRERAPLSLCLLEAGAENAVAAVSATAAIGAACVAVDWPGAFVHEIGGIETHVHLVVTIAPTIRMRNAAGPSPTLNASKSSPHARHLGANLTMPANRLWAPQRGQFPSRTPLPLAGGVGGGTVSTGTSEPMITCPPLGSLPLARGEDQPWTGAPQPPQT